MSNDDPNPSDEEMPKEEDDEEMVEPMSDEELAVLEQAVVDNVYDYNAHVALITALKSAGELEKLTTARRRFAKYFPLSPKMWLAWLKDHREFGEGKPDSDEEPGTIEWQREMVDLFERAVIDYLSVDIWIEYIQFAIGHQDALEKDITAICERAVTACGHHFTKGVLVWQLYQLVVSALQGDETLCRGLYERQLAIPSISIDEVYEEYKEKYGEPSKELRTIYDAIRADEDRMFAHEKTVEALDENSAPMQVRKAFLAYVNDEQKQEGGRSEHVQTLFERAITIAPLCVQLWNDYAKWIIYSLKDTKLAQTVYARAVRNCSWWTHAHERLLMMAELNGASAEELAQLWDNALAACQPNVQLWLTYIGTRRRFVEQQEQRDYTDVLQWFDYGAESLRTLYGDHDWDAKGHYRFAWAVFLATKARDMEQARVKLADLRSVSSQFVTFWERWMWLERGFGDLDGCRKILCEGVKKVRDDPRSMMELLEQFERDEGTADTMRRAMLLIDSKSKNIPAQTAGRGGGGKFGGGKFGGKNVDHNKNSRQNDNDDDDEGHMKSPPKGKKNEPKGKKGSPNKPQKQQQHDPSTNKKVATPKSSSTATSASPGPAKPTAIVNGTSHSAKQVETPAAVPSASVVDAQGFKAPSLPGPKPVPGAKRKADGSAGPPEKKSSPVVAPAATATESMDTDNKASTSNADGQQEADAEELFCVFISNLDFSVEKQQLVVGYCRVRDFFADVGEIETVAFSGHHGRLHRGFGHVRFKSADSVKPALAKDRQLLGKRPMFVSPFRKSADERPKKFEFNTGMDKCKLYVKNLHGDMKEPDLRELFGQYGRLKAVRLVTYRSGASKGMAYIEFEDEKQAQAALMATDNSVISGKPIQVAISNPPPRKAQPPKTGLGRQALGSTFGQTVDASQRKSASSKLQLMAPRSMAVKPTGSATSAASKPAAVVTADPSQGSKTKLTNQQFREMMMKK